MCLCSPLSCLAGFRTSADVVRGFTTTLGALNLAGLPSVNAEALTAYLPRLDFLTSLNLSLARLTNPDGSKVADPSFVHWLIG